mgnify:CR=1 FL=1
MINYGKQSINRDDINAVVETLSSDWLTQGPKIREFELALADYCGAKYAVAVSNGTAGLHLSNLVINSNPKTKIITVPITFLATANSIIYADKDPAFVDICENSFTMDCKELDRVFSENNHYSAIIPVHLGGVICDMESIKNIANKNNCWVIEDACHALGGEWIDSTGKKQKVGNCSYSDLTIFSFHPVKQITTGEGGAITTNNKELYEKLLLLRTHGMTKDSRILNENHGGWYYEMHTLGYNYRITDFQAALGIEQLKRNDEWVKARRALVENYDTAFKNIKEIRPQNHPDDDKGYSYHLYIIQCEKRLHLYEYLKKNGINTQVHYIPIHLQPYYKNRYGYKPGDYPISEKYYEDALSLPLYPKLKNLDQKKIISLVKKFYEKN